MFSPAEIAMLIYLGFLSIIGLVITGYNERSQNKYKHKYKHKYKRKNKRI